MSATVSFYQEPYDFNPANAPIWIVGYSDSYNNEGFKYVYRLYQYNRLTNAQSAYLGEYKIPPRPTGEGPFDTHKILKANINAAYNFTPTEIMSRTQSVIPVTDESCLVKFRYKYGYLESTSLTFSSTGNNGGYVELGFTYSSGIQIGDIITIEMDPTSVNTSYNGYSTVLSLNGYKPIVDVDFSGTTESNIGGVVTSIERITGTSSYKYAINGTRQYYNPNTNGQSNQNGLTDIYYDNNLVLRWNGTSSNLLTSYTGYKSIFSSCSDLNQNTYDQFETVSFLGLTHSTYNIKVKTYNVNMTLLSTYTLATQSLTQSYILYNMPVGTANLQGIGGIDFTNATYYEVKLYNGTDDYIQANRMIVQNESAFNNVRIMFLNRLGGYDYYNFNYDSKITMSIARTEFNRTLNWNYQVGNRGRTVLTTDAEQQTVINTDWVSEYDYNYLQQLFTSPEVYVLTEETGLVSGRYTTTDMNKLPIIITNTNWEQKTQLRETIFNCTITFKYAYNVNTQSN
jgi:hypothetical protein